MTYIKLIFAGLVPPAWKTYGSGKQQISVIKKGKTITEMKELVREWKEWK